MALKHGPVCVPDTCGELHVNGRAFPGGANGKEPSSSAGDARDVSSVPGPGRSPGGGHGNPLQHSCLGNPVGKGDWRATVHRVAKSQTRQAT